MAAVSQHHALSGVGTWDKSKSAVVDRWWDDGATAMDEVQEEATANPSQSFAAMSEIVSVLREGFEGDAPRASNTGGVFSQAALGGGLHAPQKYLPPVPRANNYVEVRPEPSEYGPFREGIQWRPEHWTETDPKLFASLCQGGGGIDWLSASIYGRLTKRGRRLVRGLRIAKEVMRKKDASVVQEACHDAGLKLFSHTFGDSMTFHHPDDSGTMIQLGHGTSGSGRCFYPLIVKIEGITVKYGRIADSVVESDSDRTHGPVASIEIPGLVWLRLGEVKAFLLAEKICRLLGIVIDGVRPTRVDACADLVGIKVQEYYDAYLAGCMVTKTRGTGPNLKYGPIDPKTGRAELQTMEISSGACELTIYDKVAELKAKDKTGEKTPLMIQNRWGSAVANAVRVEFKFKLGKSRARKYENFRELLLGLGDLIGWALNSWIRFCHVPKKSNGERDGSHTTRARYCDHWLRTLHAFAFWAHRLGERPAPKEVKAAPPMQLLKQAAGCLSSALGSVGLIPTDDWNAFGFLAHWLGFNQIAAMTRRKAVEQLAARGVVPECFQLEGESQDTFAARENVRDLLYAQDRARSAMKEGAEQQALEMAADGLYEHPRFRGE